jgi:hypothetical protein
MLRIEFDRARLSAHVGLMIVGLVAAACQGKIVPLSAQAGSTVFVPLQGTLDPNAVGYGGTEVVDYQRGELIYQLDGPGGFELTTRATGSALPWPGAPLATGYLGANPAQVLSLVDIPANAPLGTHDLHLVRRRIENGVPVDYPGPDYNGQITILPNEIVVPLPGGGNETVTGMPTPFQAWVCTGNCSFVDIGPDFQIVVPDPELRIQLSQDVWAVELEITYPESVISIASAFETPWVRSAQLARTWIQPGAPGTVFVSAVAGSDKFRRISVAFTLVDGASAILDPNSVGVVILKASDQNGQAVSPTVFSKKIF